MLPARLLYIADPEDRCIAELEDCCIADPEEYSRAVEPARADDPARYSPMVDPALMPLLSKEEEETAA
jgi:hypothetical protein